MDFKDLFGMVLPQGTLDYFELVSCIQETTRIDLYLEEQSYVPDGFGISDIISHGFMREVSIQDFPFRDKSMYLHIKRRRYLIKKTGQTYTRDLNLAFSGTKITAEFADFLKEVYR